MNLKTDEMVNFIFNSQGGNASYTNATSVTYFVTLSSLLIQDYDKFLAEFIFKSKPVAYATGTPEVGFVYINFSNTNMNTGQGKQKNRFILKWRSAT
jgi:hypothetical protein